MKRLSISSVLLLLVLLPALGQKRISSFNKSGDSIKVESMRGVEIYTEMTDMFSIPYSAIPVYIGYFNEKQTASTCLEDHSHKCSCCPKTKLPVFFVHTMMGLLNRSAI